MITVDQAKVLKKVLERFTAGEEKAWTDFDENMVYLDYLSDRELVLEARLCMEEHVKLNARCTHDHPRSECFVPVIIVAMSYIIKDFEEMQQSKGKDARLIKATRYMLEYYLSLDHVGTFVVDAD